MFDWGTSNKESSQRVCSRGSRAQLGGEVTSKHRDQLLSGASLGHCPLQLLAPFLGIQTLLKAATQKWWYLYFTWLAFLNHRSQIPLEEKQGCPFLRPDRKPEGCISYTKCQRRFNALLPQRVLLFSLRGSKSPFPRQSSSWAPLRARELLQPPRNTRKSVG